LYQSECGSAYGIYEGNFYYDWLMVYGGIFPTFPEPEHGKTWFLPWDYSVIKSNEDTVTIRMSYQDNTRYSGAPGGFNNGITNITCHVDISVYKNSTLWDYHVSVVNDRPENVKYEYWTCTTLAPGSEIGDTGTPLNSEIIIPVEEYFAGWSPGAWIGNNNSTYDLSNIDYLSKWDDMGIAYANNLQDEYWGVINHDVEEGIFRISENKETFGMKLWTWGKNNIDNNLYDYSNGGADNYIELWAGVSRSFFTDATLQANSSIIWDESYCATVGLTSVANMNNKAALNLLWDPDNQLLTYQLNTFQADKQYTIKLYIDDEVAAIGDKNIQFEALGLVETIALEEVGLFPGEYLARISLVDENNAVVLEADKLIEVSSVLATRFSTINNEQMKLVGLGGNRIQLNLPSNEDYTISIVNLQGQELINERFYGISTEVQLPATGLYIVSVMGSNSLFTDKIYLR
jgi:hypothetical protein